MGGIQAGVAGRDSAPPRQNWEEKSEKGETSEEKLKIRKILQASVFPTPSCIGSSEGKGCVYVTRYHKMSIK